jgi:pyruvate dehydrogenase E2 component (dihydrolipoamide acetyltransferase)
LLLEEGEDESALDEAEKMASSKGGGQDGAEKKEPDGDSAKDRGEDQDEGQDEGQDKGEDKDQTKNQDGDGSKSGQESGKSRSKGDRIFASPLARRLAKEGGLDLSKVEGSGPHGRIIKADIEKAIASGSAKAGEKAEKKAAEEKPAAAAKAPAGAGPGAKALADMLGMEYELEPLNNMRRTIAKRLTESKQSIPHFYLTIDCQIDALLSLRKELNERFADSVKISVNDFVIRAAALALMKVPAANASWDDEGLLRYRHADVSVAVATPGGLITPIIKAAETKGLATISSEMRDLAERARDGKLKPEEYQGGSFSISNLGMYGIREFAAVINPPQGCILAVGAGEKRAVVTGDGVGAATVMTCTLSVDHRAVDGAVGAEYLAALKKLIEYPLSMML